MNHIKTKRCKSKGNLTEDVVKERERERERGERERERERGGEREAERQREQYKGGVGGGYTDTERREKKIEGELY